MAVAYTKEFLINALVSRYESTFKNAEDRKAYEAMATKQYDKVGKDKFRVYASLDAEAIRAYKKLSCSSK